MCCGMCCETQEFFFPLGFGVRSNNVPQELARRASSVLPNLWHFDSYRIIDRGLRPCFAARMVLLHIKVRWPPQRCPELEGSSKPSVLQKTEDEQFLCEIPVATKVTDATRELVDLQNLRTRIHR